MPVAPDVELLVGVPVVPELRAPMVVLPVDAPCPPVVPELVEALVPAIELDAPAVVEPTVVVAAMPVVVPAEPAAVDAARAPVETFIWPIIWMEPLVPQPTRSGTSNPNRHARPIRTSSAPPEASATGAKCNASHVSPLVLADAPALQAAPLAWLRATIEYPMGL